MKNISIRIEARRILSLVAAFILLSSNDCNTNCLVSSYGKLIVENKSRNTVHEIIIDGTNYGSLDPDEEREIELVDGKYLLEFRGLNGAGCSPTFITVKNCNTEARSCRN